MGPLGRSRPYFHHIIRLSHLLVDLGRSGQPRAEHRRWPGGAVGARVGRGGTHRQHLHGGRSGHRHGCLRRAPDGLRPAGRLAPPALCARPQRAAHRPRRGIRHGRPVADRLSSPRCRRRWPSSARWRPTRRRWCAPGGARRASRRSTTAITSRSWWTSTRASSSCCRITRCAGTIRRATSGAAAATWRGRAKRAPCGSSWWTRRRREGERFEVYERELAALEPTGHARQG